MDWTTFKNKCKQLEIEVGKTWVCTGETDYTKHHKVVECWDEGYSRTVVAVNVPYDTMLKIIKTKIKVKQLLKKYEV